MNNNIKDKILILTALLNGGDMFTMNMKGQRISWYCNVNRIGHLYITFFHETEVGSYTKRFKHGSVRFEESGINLTATVLSFLEGVQNFEARRMETSTNIMPGMIQINMDRSLDSMAEVAASVKVTVTSVVVETVEYRVARADNSCLMRS